MVRYDLLLFMLKIETTTPGTNSKGIICGPHRGSFALRDHLWSSLGINSGLGIICAQGSVAALYCVVSLRRLGNILYEKKKKKKKTLQLCFTELRKKGSRISMQKNWSWDVTWSFWRKFMAIRFLSVGCNPIQVLLIRSDQVWVLSIRSDPIQSWFCNHPYVDVMQLCAFTKKSSEFTLSCQS